MPRASYSAALPILAIALFSMSSGPGIGGQEEPQESIPLFHEYDPPSTLVVPENVLTRSKYPFVDVHNHRWQMPDQDLDELVAEMDALNMAVLVNLSGRGFRRVEAEDGTTSFGLQDGDFLKRAVANAERSAPGRFVVFTNLDLHGFGTPGWDERAVRDLERDVAHGAAGLKIYKSLGMDAQDAAGGRIAVDDPRLDPVWGKCGELGIPVLIHTGDPAPFWLPKDARNERLLELMERPGRIRRPGEYPPWEEIMGEQHSVFNARSGISSATSLTAPPAQRLPQTSRNDLHRRPPRLDGQRPRPPRPAPRPASQRLHRPRHAGLV